MGRERQVVLGPPVEQVLLGGVEQQGVLTEAAERSVAAVTEQSADFLGRMVMVHVKHACLWRLAPWRLATNRAFPLLGFFHSTKLLWSNTVANVQPPLADFLTETRRGLLFLGRFWQELWIFKAMSTVGPYFTGRKLTPTVSAELHDASAGARAVGSFLIGPISLVSSLDMLGSPSAWQARIAALAGQSEVDRKIIQWLRLLAGGAEAPVRRQRMRAALAPAFQVKLHSARVEFLPAPLAWDWFKQKILLSYVNSMRSVHLRVKRNILSCCSEGGYPYVLTAH